METKEKKPRKTKEKVISKDITDIYIPLNWRTANGDVMFKDMDNEYLARVICIMKGKFSKYRKQQVENTDELNRFNTQISYHEDKIKEIMQTIQYHQKQIDIAISEKLRIEERDQKRAFAVQTNKQLLLDANTELASRGLTLGDIFPIDTIDSGNRNEDKYYSINNNEVIGAY